MFAVDLPLLLQQATLFQDITTHRVTRERSFVAVLHANAIEALPRHAVHISSTMTTIYSSCQVYIPACINKFYMRNSLYERVFAFRDD